jgi:hypothetical protein
MRWLLITVCLSVGYVALGIYLFHYQLPSAAVMTLVSAEPFR